MNDTNKIYTTQELITPEIAKKYLEKNIVNRPLRNHTLDSLVRDIKNGNFRMTHQGIAFDRYGNLIDGQHRLTACALADTPITVLVTRGMQKDDGAYIDIGAKRSFNDAITINEEFGDSVALRNKGTAAAVRNMVKYGFNSSLVLTFDEMRKLFREFTDELEHIYRASISRKSARGPVNGAALAALACGENADAIHAFFTVYLNGDSAGLSDYNIAAAYIWQRTVMDAKMRRDTIPNNDLYSGTQNAIWQFLHGDNTKLIRPTKILKYPVYDRIKTVLGGDA